MPPRSTPLITCVSRHRRSLPSDAAPDGTLLAIDSNVICFCRPDRLNTDEERTMISRLRTAGLRRVIAIGAFVAATCFSAGSAGAQSQDGAAQGTSPPNSVL